MVPNLHREVDPLKRLVLVDNFFTFWTELGFDLLTKSGATEDEVTQALHVATNRALSHQCCPVHANELVEDANDYVAAVYFPRDQPEQRQ